MRRLLELLPTFRPYRWRVAGGVAAILLSVAIGLAGPLLIGRAVDAFQAGGGRAAVLRYAGLLLAVAALQGLFSFIQRRVLVAVSRDIEKDLRNEFFAHLARQPASFFHERATGDLMARATNDLNAVRMLCGPAIMYAAQTVFTAAGALSAMARIDLGLTAIALATLPLVAGATQVFGDRIHRRFERVQAQFSRLSAKVQEGLSGVRVVRAYAQESAEERAFEALNRGYVEENKRLARWTAAFYPLLQALVGLGFVAVLWVGVGAIRDGAISVGQFVTFNFFLSKMVWPMIAVGWVINLVQRGAASFARLREVLDVVPAIADRADALRPTALAGQLELRGLTFSYRTGGEPTLGPIDLRLAAGQVAGIVGPTGAGKSTLLALIPRLFDPPAGTILLDGHDVRDLALATLRGALAVVPQETFLFSASIADNIAFGVPHAARERIAAAADLAGLADDLTGFPLGLDTLVGERGVTLSGGQKQRVALARALLREPRLLLLDDCLSAVDARTEARILANLRRAFAGRTVLVVSHRIAAVAAADLILVLASGRIVERGRHEELLARGGLYAELARLQRLEEELAAV